MRKILFGAFCSAILIACNSDKPADAGAATTPSVASADAKKPAMELLDLSTGDMLKSSYAAFGKGDIDGMTANFADNIRYTWSNGDSLIGKAAVQDFWKKRWTMIESLNFSEHIIVPLQANEQQSKYAPTGKWILIWMLSNAKYKNGNSVTFWTHSVNHLNDAGKIDYVGMYYDRAPINKATEGMTMPK